MHAWLCQSTDGPQSLRWTEVNTPEPGPSEVRLRLHAASLNFPDLLIVQGKYQVKPPLPFVPGAEFAGVVEAVGSEVKHLRVGTRVCGIGSHGGFGEQVCVEVSRVVPVPDAMPFTDAAAFVFTYGTSHHALADRGALQAGETVLVLGAAGGVGSAAVQIAKAMGARVIAAASTDDKCATCLKLGADATVNTSRDDLRTALKTLTQGRGPDVVYDPVGGALAEPALRAIAWRGRYLVVGFAAGDIPTLPLNLPLLKGASVVGVFWGDFLRREPQAGAASLQTLLGWYSEGRIKPWIDSTMPLASLPQAFERMASRQVQGKLVLLHPPKQG